MPWLAARGTLWSAPRRRACVLLASLSAPLFAQQVQSPDHAGPNSSIVRSAHGEYLYRTLSTGKARGVESWQLLVHPDGTRTLVAWNDVAPRGGQLSAVLRLARDFRQLESFVSSWSGGKHEGSELLLAEGNDLLDQLAAARGVIADLSQPLPARTQSVAWTFEGVERVDVPAGSFDAQRFAGKDVRIWVSGEDRLLVKMLWPAIDGEYLLARYQASTASVPARSPRPVSPVQTSGVPLPQPGGANPAILRAAEGRYEYRTLRDGRMRGWERFRLTVHPDGTRTLLMWHDLAARNAQFTVALRADASLRPLQAYASYFAGGRHKGSTLLTAREGALDVASRGPAGTITKTLVAPPKYSFGTHPITADGWHTWLEGPATGGEQEATVFGLEASADLSRPILGEFRPVPFRRLGKERIAVAAGVFDTVHYLLGGSDIWVTEQDRIMVRFRTERSDRDYELVELRTTGVEVGK
jgi:hypothetical protein